MTKPKPQVVVVGSYVEDLCFTCENFPRPGETLMATSQTGPGGKGSNQAVAAGRAGAPTLYVGAIANDAFGRNAKAFYKSEGIAAKWAMKTTQPTGSAAIMVNAQGQNEILVALAANAKLSKTDLPAKALRDAEIVITQLEANLTAAAEALKIGRAGEALTILNPAPMRPDFKPSILKHVDILIPNETEFVELTNRLAKPGDKLFTEKALLKLSASKLHQLCGAFGVPVVIVTLGQRGCFISRADGYLEVPAFNVKAIDTTGAGDAFVGGFAAGLLENDGDLAAAARHGCAVAALSVTKPGTAPAMPKAPAVKRFLKKHA
ncbi:ribokinase [Opitutaceae bacterium]|nr:ribokinase [Opitutaceae bacterium]